jgi:hypothetical protein
MKPKTMSGAEVKARLLPELLSLKDDDELYFADGTISFHRCKDRGPENGPRMVQVEFNEVIKVIAD